MAIMPIVTPPHDGDVLAFSPGELLVWKGTLASTGALDQLELTAQPGYAGAPEHIHLAQEECLYVLDGAFRTFLCVPRRSYTPNHSTWGR